MVFFLWSFESLQMLNFEHGYILKVFLYQLIVQLELLPYVEGYVSMGGDLCIWN